jgi:DNA-binding SARP family transcriptional activator
MEFAILGPLEVRTAKPRAVLAFLLLHANQPVSAERLAVALWGEDAPTGALKTVQVYVSRLRRALGDPELLTTTPAGYRLRVRPGELDLERFETRVAAARAELADGRAEPAAQALREALSMWRGAPLGDLASAPFAAAEVARLQEQRLTAIEVRIDADLAAGRHAELIAELGRLTAEHPWRERLHVQLMLALYRAGRQADALAVFTDVRNVLVEQLGVEPGPELRELHHAILAHEPSLDVPAAPPALAEPAPAPPAPRPPAVTSSTQIRLCGPLAVQLKGRDVALPGRQGRLAFAYLLANRRRAVTRDELVELLWPERLPGDPGEALSALLSRVRRAVGADVLTGRREIELGLPADAWIDLEAASEAADRAGEALAAGDVGAAMAAASACEELAGRGFLAGDASAWARERRHEVQELRLRALEAMAAAGTALGGGRLPDAERAARAAIEAAPFRESGHRLLMEALAARGNVAEALRVYEQLRVLLRDELGTVPGADVQALHQRLLTDGEPAVASPAAAPPPEPPTPRDERRLVTVLCAELAEAGGLLDPEELRPVLLDTQRRMRAIVERFGGSAHELGAGALLAVFGAPVAHEDDAERAVRAGLRVCELGLASRAGVASGEALVALDGREGSRTTGRVTGAAVAIQRCAPQGATAVDDETHQATREALSYEPLIETAGVWRAGRDLGVARRRARMVARDRELALLRELYESVVADRRPRLVTIVGQAGIGKSRLLEELMTWVEVEGGGAVLRGRCLAYGEGITYWALREKLWEAAGILLDDDVGTAAAKLTAVVDDLLAPGGADPAEVRRTAEALAAGAGIGLPGGALDELSPEAVAEEIGLAWPRFLGALAARVPTVAAVEDLHWAEPPLLEMVERIVARADGPLLVVTTARPELMEGRPRWGQRPGTWQIALEPLEPSAARKLVDELLPAGDGALAERVAKVAEGNPFYAEEIVRHLEHSGGSEPAIPSTVRALLAARIDALPTDEKDALQHAAVVGRTFWAAALEPTWTATAIGPRLRALEQRGFVMVKPTSSLPGQRELQFVHGLTREVAYQSIPRGARCRVHAAVAAWIESLAGGRRDEFVELLAHHYEAAASPQDAALAWPDGGPEREELRARAVRALLAAGEAARRRLALEPALRFADRALALADPGAERLEALELRADALHAAVRGDESLAAYREAIALARELADTAAAHRLRANATLLCVRYAGAFTDPSRTPLAAQELVAEGLAEIDEHEVSYAAGALLVGRAFGQWRWGEPVDVDLQQARRDAERAVDIAEAIGSMVLMSNALEALTWLAFGQGNREAVELGERHLRAAGTMIDRVEAHETVGAAAICFARGGRLDRAREVASRATREAASLGPHRALHAASWEGIALVPAGRFAELLDATGQVVEYAAEEGERICATGLVGLAARVLALYERGGPAAAADAMAVFEELSPATRPLGGWGSWITEALRDAVPLDESLARLEQVKLGSLHGDTVDRVRAALQVRALAGEWSAVEEIAREARALAGPGGAPELAAMADWAEAMRLAATRQPAAAATLAESACVGIAARGERYTADRLMAELLVRLGDDAPPALVGATAERLDAMGAHTSAAAVRAVAYAPDAGA